MPSLIGVIVNLSIPNWCIKNDNNPTYIEHPRHELIKEIWDEAGVEFWMYSNPQLLYHA